MIEIRDLHKDYPTPGGGRVTALRMEFLSIRRGDQVAVVGPSGSGKTTLLSILGGVLAASSGSVDWDGKPWGKSIGAASARVRARRVGFVFQDLNLVPSLTLAENLAAAEFFLGLEKDAFRVTRLLERVGLREKAHRKPETFSRGERQRAAIASAPPSPARRHRQRAAIARAALHPHPLLIADEPTASLDGENAALAMDLLCGLARENDSALLVATHDPRVMERLERTIELQAHV